MDRDIEQAADSRAEYERLSAERQRLIAAGIPADELVMPVAPIEKRGTMKLTRYWKLLLAAAGGISGTTVAALTGLDPVAAGAVATIIGAAAVLLGPRNKPPYPTKQDLP